MPLLAHAAQVRKQIAALVGPHPQPFSQREKGEIRSFPSDSRQVVRVQFEGRHLCLFAQLRELDHLLVTTTPEIAVLIKHVSNSTRHACRKVASSCSEHDDPSAAHVFT